MPSISSIEGLAGAFLAFAIACAAVGRPDIPIKIVIELRVKALAGTTASWGCPSVFHKALPGIVWVEAKAAAMEKNGGAVIGEVTETSGVGFYELNFAVHAFGNGICDAMAAVG